MAIKLTAMKRLRCSFVFVLVLSGAWTRAEEWQSAHDHFRASEWQSALDALGRIDAQELSPEQFDQLPYLRAECLFQLGDWRRAATEFQDFVQAQPQHKLTAQARFRIAEVAYFDGRDRTAKTSFDEFRQHAGEQWNEQACVYLGLIALRGGEYDDAERQFVRAIQQSPSGGHLEAHLGLVQVAFHRRLPNVMLERLAAVPEASKAPDSSLPVVAYWRGQAYFLLRQYDSAVDAFERATEGQAEAPLTRSSLVGAAEADIKRRQLEPAIVRLRAVAERWPTSESAERALLRLVQLEVDRTRYGEARAILSEFRDRFPDSLRVTRGRQLAGLIHLRKREYQSAIEIFQALSHAPRNAGKSDLDRAVNWYYLAEAYYGDERPTEAIEVLQRIRIDALPSSLRTRVLFALATIYEQIEEYQAALDSLNRAADVASGGMAETRIRIKRIELLCAMGHLERAFREAANWKPSTEAADALRLNALRMVAETAYAAAEDRIALRAYQGLLHEDATATDRADGISGAAWCLFRLGDRPGASQLFERFVNEFPDDDRVSNVLLVLAELYEGQDDEAAVATYQRLMGRTTDQTTQLRAGLKRAQLLSKMNRTDEALQVLDDLAAVANDADTRDRLVYERAWALIRAGRRRRAAQQFVKLRSLGNKRRYWADVTYRLALMAFEDGEYNESQDHVDELLGFLETSPGKALRPYVLYLQARLAAQREDWKGVIEPLDEILDETSHSRWGPAVLILSAEAFYRLRDYDEGLQRLERLFQDHPQLSSGNRIEGTVQLVEVQCALGEFDQARELAEQVLDEVGGNQQARLQCVIGRCSLERGDLRQATVALKAVIDRARGASLPAEYSVKARRLLADVQFQQRLYRRSLRNYLWYLSRDEDTQKDVAVWLQAGQCYEQIGQIHQAVKLYEQVKPLAQDTPFQADVTYRLKNLVGQNPLRRLEPQPHRAVTIVDSLEQSSD